MDANNYIVNLILALKERAQVFCEKSFTFAQGLGGLVVELANVEVRGEL